MFSRVVVLVFLLGLIVGLGTVKIIEIIRQNEVWGMLTECAALLRQAKRGLPLD